MKGWWVRYKFCTCRVDGVRPGRAPGADRGVVIGGFCYFPPLLPVRATFEDSEKDSRPRVAHRKSGPR